VKCGIENPELLYLQRACAQIAVNQPVHGRWSGTAATVVNASATVADSFYSSHARLAGMSIE